MRHESNHSQLAMYCHRILNSLSSTGLVVNADFLRFSVCDGSLPETQFDGVLQRLIDSGCVVANRATYRITKKGMLLKNIMNGLQLVNG